MPEQRVTATQICKERLVVLPPPERRPGEDETPGALSDQALEFGNGRLVIRGRTPVLPVLLSKWNRTAPGQQVRTQVQFIGQDERRSFRNERREFVTQQV